MSYLILSNDFLNIGLPPGHIKIVGPFREITNVDSLGEVMSYLMLSKDVLNIGLTTGYIHFLDALLNKKINLENETHLPFPKAADKYCLLLHNSHRIYKIRRTFFKYVDK